MTTWTMTSDIVTISIVTHNNGDILQTSNISMSKFQITINSKRYEI